MVGKRFIAATIILGLIILSILSTAPSTHPQSGPEATVQARYKETRAFVYDKIRGVYGWNYSYDWDTNKYTTYTPTGLPSGMDVSNVIRLDGRLDEDIWKEVVPVTVNLEPTHPWGGAIRKVSVRAINNGTWLFMALDWEDSTESRDESPRIKRPEGGFFYNETHFYSDNLYIGWWMKGGQPTVKPWFNAHYAGTTMGRVPWKDDPTAKANLWLYKAYLVDDDTRFWPLHYTTPRTFRWGRHAGQVLAHPYSHLVETHLNSTANYMIGSGVAHVSGCAFPEKELTYPWDVRGNGQWRNGVWTLEVARPFRPHPYNEPLNATMTFESGKVYWVYFGAGDGHHGENEDVGSTSTWLTLYMEPPPSSTNPEWTWLVGGVVAVAAIAIAIAFMRSRGGRHRIAAAKTPQ